MRVAAIFSVGTSTGGCPDAIAEILKTEPSLEVYLLYGDRGAPDAGDPKDFVEQIRKSIGDPRVTWAQCQAVEPYDFSQTHAQIRDFMTRIGEHNYERVYVGITGGTNPMSASLFQTAMAYLRSEIVPMYVQARGAVWQRNFVASDVRDRVIAEEALLSARSGQIRIAARLAERLPSNDPWRFLHTSLSALAHWDDFDYARASNELQHQARKCGKYVQHPLLASASKTVARLASSAGPMSSLTKEIRGQNNFGVAAMSVGWTQRVSEAGNLLVADALANAQRRIVEGRFTDSVLRSYRAAECATQMRLLKIGIHPSNGPGGAKLAFRAGLELLESAGQLTLASIADKVTNLADTRNQTYLEHGYVRVEPDQAQRCFECSLAICQHLLGAEIGQMWRRFEMRF